jgi:hypothetical protein
MNKQLARTNEFRMYRKAIMRLYGEDVEIVDGRSSWQIDKVISRDIYGYAKRKILWQGERLKDSLQR